MTLVDPGPRADLTLAGLEQALVRERVRIEDVELLLLTHQHEDHVGLAATVVERSGCAVAAPRRLAELLRDVEATRVKDERFQQGLLELHGAPHAESARVAEVSELTRAFAASVEVTAPLDDGDTLTAGGHELLVCRRPGHSPTDTIFVDGDGWALVADHLPARGRSLVLALPAEDGPDARHRAPGLLHYRESLVATEALGLRRAYPGHGGMVKDPRAAIMHQFEVQDERARGLLDRVGNEPRTAWDLVEPARSGEAHLYSEGYLLLSDVLSHLDLLAAEGRVEATDGDVIHYVRSAT